MGQKFSKKWVNFQSKNSKRDNQVVPIMLLNKSDGGDVVMSNLTLEEIKKEDKQIDVFLELSSVNSLVFDDFITKHNIKNKNFNYINKDQSFIAQQKEFKNPTIVISYNPYNITLEKNGLKTLETTKDNIEILIVDAMFTTNDILIKYKDGNAKAFIENGLGINLIIFCV